MSALEQPSPLGLSDVSIWEKVHGDTKLERRRKGMAGITSYGKRMVQSGVVILQREQKNQVAFFTGTVPTMPPEQRAIFNESFADIQKLFLKKVRYHVEEAGITNFQYVWVPEIQEKRFAATGEIYLHSHLLFTNRTDAGQAAGPGQGFIAPWIITIDLSRKLWRDSVENYVGPLDWKNAETRIEKPRSDLNKELGKYMSKGSRASCLVKAQGTVEQLPKHWFGISDGLRSQVKAEIIVYYGEEAQKFLDLVLSLEKQGLAKVRKVCYHYIDSDGQQREGLAGYVGYLRLSNARFERLRLVA